MSLSRPWTGGARRRLGVALLVCCVVLAGCGGNSTETTTGPSTAPTVTDTTATTTTGSLVRPPLNGTALRAAHRSHLRERGSVTVRSNLTLTQGATTLTQSTVARLDLAANRALLGREPLGGAPTDTYLAANGSAYQRIGSGDATRVLGPDQVSPPSLDRQLGHRGFVLIDNASLNYAGTGSVDGVDGHVYRASGVTALEDAAFGIGEGINRSTVRTFEFGMVLAESGYVKLLRYTLTYRNDDGATVRIRDGVRFSRVGTTTVPTPDWVTAAVRQARQPEPSDPVTRTYTVAGTNGSVAQAITAPKADNEAGPGIGPVISENPVYYNPTLNGTRVGPVVRLYWPESATRVNATVRYREENVPEDDEAGLTVAILDEEVGTFVPITEKGATVRRHPEADAISVIIEDPARLERYQGRTVLVMNVELFRERAFG